MADATLKKYHSRKILRFKKNNQNKVLNTLKHSQIHSTSLTNQFTSSHSQRTSQQHSTFTTFTTLHAIATAAAAVNRTF